MYSNAQILAAVVTEWSRPVLSQLTIGKLCQLPAVIGVQNSLINLGLVSRNYSLMNDLQPFMTGTIDSFIGPMLESYFAKVPDKSLPMLAKSIVDTALLQDQFSVLDGLITFEHQDIIELSDLISKNFKFDDVEKYNVIK